MFECLTVNLFFFCTFGQVIFDVVPHPHRFSTEELKQFFFSSPTYGGWVFQVQGNINKRSYEGHFKKIKSHVFCCSISVIPEVNINVAHVIDGGNKHCISSVVSQMTTQIFVCHQSIICGNSCKQSRLLCMNTRLFSSCSAVLSSDCTHLQCGLIIFKRSAGKFNHGSVQIYHLKNSG